MPDDDIVVASLENLKSTGKIIVLFLENLNQILGEQMEELEVKKLRSILQVHSCSDSASTTYLPSGF